MSIKDEKTAEAFATSWNNLPDGSVYSKDQFEEWMLPLTSGDVKDKAVLELGCGNASLLSHMTSWAPAELEGVDLGSSVLSAKMNMKSTGFTRWKIQQGDLTEYNSEGKDVVYCIGVLHHLKEPHKGFVSVIRNTKSGGKFHCWVYAHEGNAVIRYIVDPIRRIASRLPWWFTKYGIATPLAFLYFLYAHVIVGTRLSFLPLYSYSRWISQRGFLFFRHVAFDQLVTPQTRYIHRAEIESWLRSEASIDPASTYIIFRNGNSWKFGGRKK